MVKHVWLKQDHAHHAFIHMGRGMKLEKDEIGNDDDMMSMDSIRSPSRGAIAVGLGEVCNLVAQIYQILDNLGYF